MSKPLDGSSAAELYMGHSSRFVLVIGKSGRGKSTAMENLNPEDTFLINSIGKDLPFMKGVKYISGKNMLVSADANKIRRMMKEVSDNKTWKHLVIDDLQYIMATEFMDKAMEKGYDKWNILARNIWEILMLASKLRPGLTVFLLTHEDDTGTERKMKTLGRLLEDKITPEGTASMVLYADVILENKERKFVFTTQSDGFTSAKAPRGMFPKVIPNDLRLVSDRIDEYYSGVLLKDSKLKFNL
jgi:hypothetical protein